MIKVAVCDDSNSERYQMVKKFEKYAKLHNIVFSIEEYSDGSEIVKDFAYQFDIIILDVQMRSMNGIEAAKIIRQQDEEVNLIFCTNYREYAFDGYQVGVGGYLAKPIDYMRFENEIRKAMRNISIRSDMIMIRFGSEIRTTRIANILYVESFEHKLQYHFTDGTTAYEIGKLSEVLMKDSKDILIQTHQSYLVNKLWVRGVEKGTVYLKGLDFGIPISQKRQKMVREQYIMYCMERML